GFPISKTKISPPLPMVPACSTNWQASLMVIKYRIISLWVTVTGPPAAICFLKYGITEPLEPSTFPKRVVINRVLQLLWFCNDCTYISAALLEAPITLVGFTALSVETITNFWTSYFTERFARLMVPPILTYTASCGFFSINGTCLYAAA